jgi:hypothetical protein
MADLGGVLRQLLLLLFDLVALWWLEDGRVGLGSVEADDLGGPRTAAGIGRRGAKDDMEIG